MTGKNRAYSDWYERNKETFNKKRKKRYHSDPEYKATVRGYQKGTPKEPLPPVEGLFTLAEAAAQIGKNAACLYAWEREGLVPQAYRRGAQRVYTAHQVELLKKLTTVLVRGKYSAIKYHSLKQAVIEEIKKEWTLWQ